MWPGCYSLWVLASFFENPEEKTQAKKKTKKIPLTNDVQLHSRSFCVSI